MFSVTIAAVAAASLVKGARAVECSNTCFYEVKANMMWDAERFPTDFPPTLEDPTAMMNPHWSPLWTVAHDDSFVLWRNDTLSNPGIQQIAETGAGEFFMEEVEACGASCGEGEGFPCMPFSGVCESKGEVRMTAAYPYLSAASMVAPSPDWFAGVDSVPLCVEGEWVESITREVFPYDAGTDSGESYLSPDAPTTPAVPIFRFTEVIPESDNIFYNPTEGRTLPIGSVTITRVSCDVPQIQPLAATTTTTPTTTPAPAAAPAPATSTFVTATDTSATATATSTPTPATNTFTATDTSSTDTSATATATATSTPATRPAPPPPAPIPVPPTTTTSGCGAGGQPVCSGDALKGRMYECDFGYFGVRGMCIPYEEHKKEGKAGKEGKAPEELQEEVEEPQMKKPSKMKRKSLL